MVSSVYAGVATLLVVWLTLQVVGLRRARKVSLGDGGDPQLRNTIRSHGNAVETIPLSLILLTLAELSGAPPVLLHGCGTALLIGRGLHARGLLAESMGMRVMGMRLTVFAQISLSLANLWYASAAGLNGSG